MIVYLAYNDRPDNECWWFNVDEGASDETFIRGYTFDNLWSGYERTKVREVPKPTWAIRDSWQHEFMTFEASKLPRCRHCRLLRSVADKRAEQHLDSPCDPQKVRRDGLGYHEDP
jgi:hypothetical protein